MSESKEQIGQQDAGESVKDESAEVKQEDAPPRPAPPPHKSSKKRTKTGCITCRKRRIKCGEERPVCKNCIKSKRDCGGYIQPVVFKQPNGDVRMPGNDTGGLYHGTLSGIPSLDYLQQAYGHTGHYFPADAPFNYHHGNLSAGFQPGSQFGYVSDARGTGNAWSTTPDALGYTQQGQIPGEQYANISRLSQIHRNDDVPHTSQPEWTTWYPTGTHAPGIYSHSQSDRGQMGQQLSDQLPSGGQGSAYGSTASYRQSWTGLSRDYSDPQIASAKPQAFPPWTAPHVESQTGPLKQEPNNEFRRYSVHGFIQRPSFDLSIPTSTEDPHSKMLSHSEESYGNEDEQSDLEMDLNEEPQLPPAHAQRQLSSMLVKYGTQDRNRMRTFTTFLTPSVLTTYKPSHAASPLHDEKVARIFCHFISVMGPCISVYERQAFNSPITFQNVAVPASQKMLWTYTMPSIALHTPALLHAMLALAALHISKIQNTSDAPSLKHFTYAVRRVGRLLGLPTRRYESATLAAVLLLGFYEVMSADHSRWSLHLAGAKDLVMEIDFAGMTRTTRRMRSRAKANFAQKYASSYEEYLQIAGIPETLLNDVDWEVDEELVSRLMGLNVQYSRQWQPNLGKSHDLPDFTERDIEEYKVKSDLRWWYCKQDIFQGMVSGDPLLMPFEYWAFCPPRGQIGKLDAAYATMDHLCLIMGRLIDFGGKDRPRKQKVVAAQGGQWRPPPGFFGQPREASSSNSLNPSHPNLPAVGGHRRTTPGSAPQPTESHMPQRSAPPVTSQTPLPGMYGMIPPPTEPVEMHSAFRSMDANIHDPAFSKPIPPPDRNPLDDLEVATVAAIKEHTAIVSAFDTFAQSLGPDFQPLSSDSNPSISTPFGPALQYRTYAISCIWGFYYVGRILLHRLHPHMPPAAMISAGVTAHLTKDYAQLVGKICAGLYFPQQHSLEKGILNPHLGAALIESTFFLLFAGVQYQNAVQRGWTISKLNDIARMTGWQTSASVAAACEAAWHKMGQAGKGPPYVPTMDRNNKDVRVRAIFKPHTSLPKPEGLPQEKTKDEPAFLSYDRDLIDRNPASRVHWALGLLSFEEDIAKMSLDDK